MATVTDEAVVRSFDAGRVIGGAFDVLAAHGAVIAVGSLLAVGVPYALTNWLVSWLLSLTPEGARGVSSIVANMAQGCVIVSLQAYVTGWVSLIVVARVTGATWVKPRHMVPQVARLAVPVALAALVAFVCTALGLFLVLVPGIMLAVAWAVFVPALIVENLGPTRALGRSLELTRGHRWSIFGLAFATAAVLGLANIVVVVLLAQRGVPLVEAMATPLARLVVSPLLNALSHALFASGVAALYVELVTLKDGVVKSAIAEVFD